MAVFEHAGKEWGQLDFVVHAIAFSDKDELKGRYVDTSRDNFLHVHGYLRATPSPRRANTRPKR
jgi:enoyl-[acyl-carrier-protein] reductase (NADH)